MTQTHRSERTEAPTDQRPPKAAATNDVLHRREYATPEISFVAAPTMTA